MFLFDDTLLLAIHSFSDIYKLHNFWKIMSLLERFIIILKFISQIQRLIMHLSGFANSIY